VALQQFSLKCTHRTTNPDQTEVLASSRLNRQADLSKVPNGHVVVEQQPAEQRSNKKYAAAMRRKVLKK
jgi:hypothetical protein